MLTDPALRSKIDSLWGKLWSGGLSNPLDAIEQLSFLLFLKRLDEREQDAERAARLHGKKYQLDFLRCSNLATINMTQLRATIPTPPILLQRKSGEILHSQARLARTYGESRRQAEHLFQTLLHRASTSGL